MRKFSLILGAVLSFGVAASNGADLDQFTRTQDAAISGHNIEHLNSVTEEECATACLDLQRSNWCVSFDYYKNSSACDLSDKRAHDVGGLKTDYVGNPYDHYSLHEPVLEQFTHTENAAISGFNTEQLTGVTPEDCASACLDASRSPWCVSFDYHKNTSKCDLSNKSANLVGGLKIDYAGNPYDHYGRVLPTGVPNPIPGNRHVLLIGIDGLRGDSIQCAGCASTPAMDSLIASGAFHSDVVAGGIQSTYSGPGWSSVFTGYWADEHGVTSNSSGLTLQKPHVFDLIKDAYPTAETAVVADWFNLTNNLLPADVDYVVANSNKNSQQATDTVKNWLNMPNPPVAIFYYLHNVDIHTHSYAPLHATYQQKVTAEDAQIQQVLDALVQRPHYQNEEWLIVVTSDHGGLNTGHGGQSASERNTFVILNNNYLNPGKASYCVGNLDSVALTQVDGTTPHILDFLGLPNTTAGVKHPSCGN